MAGVTQWYVDADDGDAGNTGNAPNDAFALLSEAVAAAITDGSAGQIVNIMHSAAAITETAQVTTTLTGLVIQGYDDAGNTADLDAYDPDGAAVIVPTHAGSIVRYNGTSLTLRGLHMDADGNAFECVGTTGGSTVIEAYDCIFEGSTSYNVRTRNASKLVRCTTRDAPIGVSQVTSGLECEATVFDTLSTRAWDKASSANTAVARNCTVINCCSGSTGINTPFEYADTIPANWTIQNCLLVDNYCLYGLPGSTYEANCCYTSDGGTYHTSGNWQGSTDADDYEIDPDFIDAASEDYRLGEGNALALLGVTNSVESTRDRVALSAPFPIGAYYSPPVAVTYVHTPLRTEFNATFSGDSIGDAWEIWPHRVADNLRMVVLISLGTDRLAGADDELPVGDTDRRGWWADAYNDRPIGSRLWLLESRSVNDEAVKLAKDYADEALVWLVEDGLVDAIEVTTTRPANTRGRIAMSVTVTSNGNQYSVFATQDLWEVLRA